MRSWLLALWLVGCYRPEPQAGARCAQGDVCPSGLACRGGFCVDESTPPLDAAIADAPDARPLDAVTPDAIDSVGCSDGAREAFTDLSAFPAIAGCAASWNGALGMRAARTGQACGDDVQLCAVPADACAAGWHVCGTNGQADELTTRVSQDDCAAATGSTVANPRFVTAFSHCSSYDMGVCAYAAPLPCDLENDCSEPVCCGPGCRNDAGCTDGAYVQATRIAGSTTNGCGQMLAADVSGVLCCR